MDTIKRWGVARGWGLEREGKWLMGQDFFWEWWKCSRIRQWFYLHEVINGTELYTAKIINFCGNLISLLDRKQTDNCAYT